MFDHFRLKVWIHLKTEPSSNNGLIQSITTGPKSWWHGSLLDFMCVCNMHLKSTIDHFRMCIQLTWITPKCRYELILWWGFGHWLGFPKRTLLFDISHFYWICNPFVIEFQYGFNVCTISISSIIVLSLHAA